MRHPDQLFGRPHEHALIDPGNVYVLEQHLPCAAHESPLTPEDEGHFGHGFIEIVMVGAAYRRRGLGAALIAYFQSICAGSKLFSSTNMSNRPMQELFIRAGFRPSGYIDNLDENDPEIVFYSPL